MQSVSLIICCLFLFLAQTESISPNGVNGRQEQVNVKEREDAAVRELSNRDPVVRQHGAETIANLVAMNERTMLEGYRLQEKNARVKLAMDWALYRLGRENTLFSIVKDLDSDRQAQAVVYLNQMESPEPLYIFLDKSTPSVKVALFDVFGRIGNDTTLKIVKDYSESDVPDVARAAKHAEEQINLRLNYQPSETKGRPRKTGVVEPDPTP